MVNRFHAPRKPGQINLTNTDIVAYLVDVVEHHAQLRPADGYHVVEMRILVWPIPHTLPVGISTWAFDKFMRIDIRSSGKLAGGEHYQKDSIRTAQRSYCTKRAVHTNKVLRIGGRCLPPHMFSMGDQE
jgi:hypothetical protein